VNTVRADYFDLLMAVRLILTQRALEMSASNVANNHTRSVSFSTSRWHS